MVPPAPVRWRDDTGWELRCPDCAKRGGQCFWPLTDEFWQKRAGMQRCRACMNARDARLHRQAYARNVPLRERRREYNRKYRAANRPVARIKDQTRQEQVKADPLLLEQSRERGRRRQAAYRARKRAAA